jgi:hypothetical protein
VAACLGTTVGTCGEGVLSSLMVAGGDERGELGRILAAGGVVVSCLIFGGGVDSTWPDRVVLGLSTGASWRVHMVLKYSSLV